MTRISSAKAAFKKANKMSPESNYGKIGIAYLKFASHNFDERLLILEEILDEDPSILEALMLKRHLLHLKKDYPNAVKAFHQYHELLPKYLIVRIFSARDLIQNKQFSEATKHLNYLLGLFPEQPYANQLKGVIAYGGESYQSSLFSLKKRFKTALFHHLIELSPVLVHFNCNSMRLHMDI
jgi:tetratricopeptide (TPR) repeat protein